MKKTLIVIALTLILVGCTKAKPHIVAEVNGTKITAADLIEEMKMDRNKFDPALIKDGSGYELFRKQALDKLIQKTIVLDEAKRVGIKVDSPNGANEDSLAKGIAEQLGVKIEVWKKSQEERLIIQQLLHDEVTGKIPVKNAEIKSYYHKHIKDFKRPAQYKARQIVVNDHKQADKILAKLKSGEDFAELAREYSLSPDKEQGGELGYFDARSYPKIFEVVCQKLKIGETSDVVSTEYGYQIFQLQDRRTAHMSSLEEATPLIKERIQETRSEGVLKDWFATLQSKATISINNAELKEVELAPKQ
jgi:peptidyl-prolyl cis-trans isomerase C